MANDGGVPVRLQVGHLPPSVLGTIPADTPAGEVAVALAAFLRDVAAAIEASLHEQGQ